MASEALRWDGSKGFRRGERDVEGKETMVMEDPAVAVRLIELPVGQTLYRVEAE
jgi:hypothetical protein